MMRVLINAASANMGGAVTYLQNLLRWLPEVAPDSEFHAVVPAGTDQKLQAVGGSNVEIVTFPHRDTGGGARLYFDQVNVPRMIRDLGADLLFSSTGFGTLASPVPQALLVRNPVYFNRDFHAKYRELGRSLRRNTMRRWHSLASIRSSDLVLFPTEAMREMVAEYIDLSVKETAAVHYGFDQGAFSRGASSGPAQWHSDVVRWKAEGYQLLLNVSTYAVHKNFELLPEVLSALRARGLRLKVVTTTSREQTTDKLEYDAFQARIAALGVRDDLVELGYVPYGQLGSLYDLADAYIFPSFTESFGHSMVEAMAAGLPMVASGVPVNREVCGVAGVYFDTFEPESCAEAVTSVLLDPARQQRLRAESLARARHFSWEDYARRLVDLFRGLVHPGLRSRAASGVAP